MTAPSADRHDGPLLTREIAEAMRGASCAGQSTWRGSFDLGRSEEDVAIHADGWRWRGRDFPWPSSLRERTVYRHEADGFVAVQHYSHSLIKLVPTPWGAPTFEIDGIKMLPTAQVSPWEDAQRKVALVAPRGKHVIDTCGGLGYFARACIEEGAASVRSFEKNADVLWLRRINPWSPHPDECGGRLHLERADVAERIATLPDRSFDAALHDPPRFGIAGELYSQAFYDQLARVLRPNGRLFHYTGTPNRKTSGRDVPMEVSRRLAKSGFRTELVLDGVFAVLGASPRRR